MAAVLTMSAGPFPIQRFTLSNGLPVIYAQKTDLPLTVLRLVIYAGKRDETEGKWGLANLTAEMLTEGTTSRTSDEISEEIEFLGAQLGVDAGIYTTQITLNILTSQLDKGLALTSDVLQHPTFPASELDKLKDRILSSLQESLNDPDQVLDEAFHRALYGHHPLARPEEGTPTSIRALKREDLIRFHRTYYSPKNSFLAVVTNLPLQEMRDLLEKALGSWKGPEVQHRAFPPLPKQDQPRVVLVPMKVNQAYVALGHYGVRRTDPDYPRIRLMNYILGGGGFASRFFRIIRNKMGYAYSVYGYFMPGLDLPGYYLAGMQTKVESANEAIQSLIEVMETFQQEGPTEDELRDAKSFYEGSIPRQTETYGQILGALVNEELYGLPDYYWIKEIEAMQHFSREDIQQAARTYLHPDRLVLTLVVPPDFSFQVRAFRDVKVEVWDPRDLLKWEE